MKNILNSFFVASVLFGNTAAQGVFVKHYGDFSGTGNSVIADFQGNFLLAGSRNQLSYGEQFCIYKINSIGDTLWMKLYGGSLDDYADKVIPTSDGGYALIGYSTTGNGDSRITFVKIQSSGSLSWTKTIGGLAQESATSILQTASGEYFIGGTKTNVNRMSDFYLIKTDAIGDTLWTRSYGGNLNETINSIALCSDGGIIMTGYTESYGSGSKDFYLVKVDNIGNVLWSKTYGGTLTDIATAVKQTADGGYVLAGCTNYSSISGNIFIARTNAIGDTLWTKTFTGNAEPVYAYDVIITQDGGFAIAGYISVLGQFGGVSRSDVYLLKLASDGSLQNSRRYNLDPFQSCFMLSSGNSIIQLPDGCCVVGGTFFNCSDFEMLLIETCDIGPVGLKQIEKDDIKIFPNPTTDKITLYIGEEQSDYSLSLFDFNGSQVLSKKYFLSNQLTIEKGNLPPGIYLFLLKNNFGQIKFGKIAFE